VRKDFSTPESFQHGVLFCKDVLSRMLFYVILKNKTAKEMKRAFEIIDTQFKQHYKGQNIQSIAFDQERSIVGKEFQDFVKEKKWKFVAFKNSSSKAKFAENAIGLVRTDLKRLEIGNAKGEKRWWHLLPTVVESLNKKPIRINQKFIKNVQGQYYRPIDVVKSNLNHFVSQLQKAAPAYFFTQFEIDPRWVKFNFQKGQFVRVKLIVSSSELLGTKRSELTLKDEIFVIERFKPYVSHKFTIEKAYVCKSIYDNEEDTFEEQDIALTPSPFPKTT
jgi:hypothetical protein